MLACCPFLSRWMTSLKQKKKNWLLNRDQNNDNPERVRTCVTSLSLCATLSHTHTCLSVQLLRSLRSHIIRTPSLISSSSSSSGHILFHFCTSSSQSNFRPRIICNGIFDTRATLFIAADWLVIQAKHRIQLYGLLKMSMHSYVHDHSLYEEVLIRLSIWQGFYDRPPFRGGESSIIWASSTIYFRDFKFGVLASYSQLHCGIDFWWSVWFYSTSSGSRLNLTLIRILKCLLGIAAAAATTTQKEA